MEYSKTPKQYEEHSEPLKFKQDFIDNLHFDDKQHLLYLSVSESKTGVWAVFGSISFFFYGLKIKHSPDWIAALGLTTTPTIWLSALPATFPS